MLVHQQEFQIAKLGISLWPLEWRRMVGGRQAATRWYSQSCCCPGCPPPTSVCPHLHQSSWAGDWCQSQEKSPQEGYTPSFFPWRFLSICKILQRNVIHTQSNLFKRPLQICLTTHAQSCIHTELHLAAVVLASCQGRALWAVVSLP